MSLLPPNSSYFERALEASASRIGNVPIGIDYLWNPDLCPVDLLPWLAWALSVDDWESSWSEAQKRSVIKSAVAVQRIKGTRAAVQRALDSYGNRSLLWEPKDDIRLSPFTFRVDVEIRDRPVELEADYEKSLETINRTKNVRSHLTDLNIVTVVDGILQVNTAVQAGELGEVYPYFGGEIVTAGFIYTALAPIMYEIGTVYPGTNPPLPNPDPEPEPEPPTPTPEGTLQTEDLAEFIFLEDGVTPLEFNGVVVAPPSPELDIGTGLLLQDGTPLALEADVLNPNIFYLLEQGDFLLLETGFKLIIDL